MLNNVKSRLTLCEEYVIPNTLLITTEILASFRDGGRAAASNKDCSISNSGLPRMLLNFLLNSAINPSGPGALLLERSWMHFNLMQ